MEIVITGQQKIMLDKWQKGILKNEDLYNFLASRVSSIPWDILKNGSDEEAINFCINNSKVKTDPHDSINFYSRLSHNRIENRRRLKQSGAVK